MLSFGAACNISGNTYKVALALSANKTLACNHSNGSYFLWHRHAITFKFSV